MAAEAKEGIKWPDKTPERLQDLCVFYVVNNIRRILGSIADKLIRTGNTTLSHVLGNQLLDYLINCCLPNISYLNRNQIEDVQIFFNKKFAGVSRIELHRCNIQTLVSLSVLEALKEHRLNEIALHCALSENEVAAFSSLIQSQINSLNKLTIPDTPGDTLGQIFFSKEQNHPQKSAREPDVVRELTAQLSSMTNLESRGQEPSSSHGKPKEKMLIFPKLTALYLYKYDTSLGNSSFGDVLLKHKTLSSCGIYKTALLQDQSYPRMEPIPSKILESLLHLADLSSLCLVQSSLQSDAFEYLAALQNLRHLDLSFCVMENGEDIEPNHMHLVKLVQRIPKLVSLDISCTKFGGIMQSLKSQGEGEQGEIAVLPGLEGRWFEFLGLWQVIPDVCGLQDIPAKKITGTACEEQIISALYIYQNNIPLLKEVLAHIKNTQLYEPENPYQMLNGVQLCLRTLQSQTEEALVVEVFFQLFSKCYMHIPQNQRREILVLILIIINKNKQPTIEQIRRVGQVTSGIIYPDQDLMQYLIYTLCTGYFAHTAIYSYCFEQYVDTLCTLLCLMNPYYGGSCQYTVCGANLLNHACAIGLDYKILIGEMGIIQRLLEIMLNVTDFLYMQLKKIFLLLPRHLFPFLSELWNILWNLTDEAPENSARFCSNGGVSLFTKTVQILRDGNFFSTGAEDTEAQHQTARCMIGTLGNVSEVQSQRTQLMNKDCIMAVRFILQHNDEKIDIDTSIFCVYILLHMLSFRLDKWMDESISPFDVLEEVRKVMLLWDVRAKRKTTYTSLLPIITLLECQASPREESQYVAAWILCNLTTVNARDCGMSQVDIIMHAGIDDLMHLVGPLTENTLLNCLHANFFAGIYQTKIGTVLLCLNPNQQQVTPKALSDSLKSSPFLQCLVSEALASHFDTGHSQILIVSGESGSGKTHHARQLLGRLFDMAGGGPETDAFKHLSASLTVLQSLCSAATITNPDSSRVGYFIENYISDAAIYRTKIHCYILDKDRIVNIGKHEKNFHIFYQMLAGLNAEEKVKLHLSGYSTHNLRYLSPGVTQQNEAIDKKRFESWKNSLSMLGISFYDIMWILSAILLLGNVEFVEGPGLELDLVGNNEIKAVAALLGVSGVSLYRGFTTQTRNNRGQICRSIADVHAANHTKDALAKALYCRTMVSILRRANNMKCSNPTLSSESLDSSQDTSVPGGLSCHYSLTALTHSHQSSHMTRNKGVISILDMFGFEIAEVNGLEQLCINLCAETMQAFYNTHMFKSTQEALREDGIQLNADFFYFDNDPILELLSSRRDGILSLIDTECLVSKSTAVSLVLKIKSHHRINNYFFEPLPKAESLFGICHFAGKVIYDVTKFIPNNKDQISDDIVAIFSKQFCSFGFASYLFSHEIIQGNETGGRLQGIKHRILPYSLVDKSESSEYVGSLTQDSKMRLNNLLKILVHAKPHFVRCIKTNDQGESLVFDRETMIRQLKSLQVLETVHLMAGGLAHRMRYKAFKKRYSPFIKHRDSCKSESNVEECKAILDSFLKAMDSSQLPYVSTQWILGKKYIFLSESTRQHLEAVRWERLHYYATLIKSQWKGYICRKTWPVLKQQLHDQHLKWMTTVPSTGQNLRSAPKYEREKIENYHLLQMAAQLYKIDLGKPPRLPPSRSYTISDMMKLKYPQVRIMKKDYPTNSVDGRKLSKGEQVNVIRPAPGRGFLVVQQRDTTLHIPHMLVELQSEPEAVGMDI